MPGKGVGREGMSYAIPTKESPRETLPLVMIAQYVDRFLEHARANPDDEFFVTRIGCGLAGYADEVIAPLFEGAPDNCSFAQEWRRYLEAPR